MISDPMATNPGVGNAAPQPAAVPPTFTARLLRLAFVIFCFEIGVFLLVFPWMPIWENNMMPAFAPWLEDLWGNPFFRGALSGVGLVNIYISFAEMVRLVRASGS
jgi:hypothetical protein